MTYIYTAAALIIAIAGFLLGHKTKRQHISTNVDSLEEAENVLNDQAEDISSAGDSLADSLADPLPQRVESILGWLRSRSRSK